MNQPKKIRTAVNIVIIAFIFVTSGILSINAQHRDYRSDSPVKINSGDLVLTKENPQPGQRYTSAGSRCYINGMQDGGFPPMGWHNKDEMGGVWLPPLKAADGLWLRINGKHISSAAKYVRKAAWSEFEFQSDELTVKRIDAAMDNQPGALFIYIIKNNSSENKNLSMELITRFHPILSYPFVQSDEDYSKNKGAFQFKTVVRYNSSLSCLEASTDKFKRFVICKTNIKPAGFSLAKQSLPIPKSSSYFQDTESDGLLKFNLEIEAGAEIKFIAAITGSMNSKDEANKTADEILNNSEKLLEEKENKYVEIANRTVLATPDETINKAFLWNKLNMAMQVIDVPGLGTGAVAGYPDYPWFFGNDGSFSVPGLLAIGQVEPAKEHLRLVASVSNKVNNSSGKIVHEIVTDGSVFWGRNTDPGNTNETCQFAKAVGQIWNWTGDEEFLRELYPTVKKGMLDWLINTQTEKGDIFPGGFGNAEVTGWGVKRLDVQCYAVEGFLSLAQMAEYMGESDIVEKSKEWAARIKEGINTTWWMKDKGYYANSLTRDNKPVLLGEISPVPLESKVADADKADILLDSMTASNENNEYGYGDMSISSGWAAVAAANYGEIDHAIKYIRGIANLWDIEMPGGLPEHNPPYKINPKHTQWRTNSVQLWGGYGLHFPIIRYILGVEPRVPNKIIRIIPNIPGSWDRIECSNLQIADDTISVSVTRNEKQLSIEVDHSGGFELEVGSILPESQKVKRITLNGVKQSGNNLVENKVLAGRQIFIRTDAREVLLTFEIE